MVTAVRPPRLLDTHSSPTVDVTAVVVCRDDEERVGHQLRRLAAHLRALHLRFEILAVDEGSWDNTLSLLALMKRSIPELDVVAGVEAGRGLARGAELARGRAVLILDARAPAPLPVVNFSLQQIEQGRDVVAVAGRCLVLHRTHSWRAFGALEHHRDPADLERRFLRRARQLGLAVQVTASGARPATGLLGRLRNLFAAPLPTRS